MNELFIIDRITELMHLLGYKRWHKDHVDLFLPASETVKIPAYNMVYFIIGDPVGITIESDYGLYDSSEGANTSNVHEHKGEITITNPGAVDRRVKFMRVVIVG